MTTDTVFKPKVRLDLKEPGLFNVIYLNDNVTTMEFVIESLAVVFGIDKDRGHEITIEVHEQGSSIVATLSFEIAEQKGLEVQSMARKQGYPFQVRVEAE